MTVPKLLDLRSEQKNPFPPKGDPPKSPSLVKAGKTVVRDAKVITGITLHQTACVFGPEADRAKAHRRALNIPAHVTAFRDGVFVAAAPLRWYLYHGNALNEFTLGLECEGHYPGLLDDPTTPKREDEATTWGGNATPLDATAIDTFRAALRWLVETGRAEGMPIKNIYAHRQASGQKPSDPGQGLWQEVALWGVRELGLVTRASFVLNEGKPIPAQWEQGATAKY